MRGPTTGANRVLMTSVSLGRARPHLPVWLVAVLLALVTIAVYWPTTSHDFVNYDDDLYVTSNVHAQTGLTWQNIRWALFNPVTSNWHPLTIWSHMADCQLFGLRPWGHHLTSVLLHAFNTVLVFLFLWSLTRAVWRSVLAAALFGLHPAHVESVAWVAERKDVLSTCFGILSLMCYACFTQISEQRAPGRTSKPEGHDSRPAAGGRWLLYYLASLLFFALGLMSKAMLVTWPFVMLLLDYWPLERFKPRRVWRLVAEKVPFFALAAAVSVVTFAIQKQEHTVKTVEEFPLGARCENALVSYCRYLGKLFWPTDLAVFYPPSRQWPVGKVLLAGVALVGVSLFLFGQRRRYPFLLMGGCGIAGR